MSCLELNFDDLAPVEVRVSIRHEPYVLTEASGDAAVKYRNAAMGGAKMLDGKVVGVSGVADVEPLLVALCLTKIVPLKDGGEDRRPVSVNTVRSWPVRVQKALFNKVKEISEGLEEKETEDTLRKRLADTQAKLDELLAAGEGDPAKNGTAAMQDTQSISA